MLTSSIVCALCMAVLLTAQTKPAPPSKPASPARAEPTMAELWSEPEPDRDLFYGVGGARLVPDPKELYEVTEIKIGGFSEGYSLIDSQEREWSVKFPPEALSEIVVSRLHWALGYHQPPLHLLREWNAKGATSPNPQLPARFRAKSPDFNGLQSGANWAFKDNPFVGTRQMNALLVLQAIVENPDVKPSNNTIYELKAPAEGASRWYVVRDLGYSLGRAGFNSPRTDIDAFERAPFIRGVVNGKVQFHYGGQFKSTLRDVVTVEDVRWLCERLGRLTDRQWHDAFRAAGYELSVSDRYISRFKARIAEGLALH